MTKLFVMFIIQLHDLVAVYASKLISNWGKFWADFWIRLRFLNFEFINKLFCTILFILLLLIIFLNSLVKVKCLVIGKMVL